MGNERNVAFLTSAYSQSAVLLLNKSSKKNMPPEVCMRQLEGQMRQVLIATAA